MSGSPTEEEENETVASGETGVEVAKVGAVEEVEVSGDGNSSWWPFGGSDSGSIPEAGNHDSSLDVFGDAESLGAVPHVSGRSGGQRWDIIVRGWEALPQGLQPWVGTEVFRMVRCGDV